MTRSEQNDIGQWLFGAAIIGAILLPIVGGGTLVYFAMGRPKLKKAILPMAIGGAAAYGGWRFYLKKREEARTATMLESRERTWQMFLARVPAADRARFESQVAALPSGSAQQQSLQYRIVQQWNAAHPQAVAV